MQEGGYDEAIFVDPDAINDAFLCGICLSVLRKPVQCKEGHACCTECLHGWIDGIPEDV